MLGRRGVWGVKYILLMGSGTFCELGYGAGNDLKNGHHRGPKRCCVLRSGGAPQSR